MFPGGVHIGKERVTSQVGYLDNYITEASEGVAR